jgi:hypothetical protein
MFLGQQPMRTLDDYLNPSDQEIQPMSLLRTQELLVDLTYCVHEDSLYCERHYAER